jgi:uridylate kinase
MIPEPFVSTEEAAAFLAIKRRHLLVLARKGISGAYPLDPNAKRRVWVFRLTELAAAITDKNSNPRMREVCDPTSGSPR